MHLDQHIVLCQTRSDRNAAPWKWLSAEPHTLASIPAGSLQRQHKHNHTPAQRHSSVGLLSKPTLHLIPGAAVYPPTHVGSPCNNLPCYLVALNSSLSIHVHNPIQRQEVKLTQIFTFKQLEAK
jgi:hypothetical protein